MRPDARSCVLALFPIAAFVFSFPGPGSTETFDQLRLAPVNPAFIEYQAAAEQGLLKSTSPDGQETGFVPSYMDKSHLRSGIAATDMSASVLPARFDWRSSMGFNGLTPVKDQSVCGSCWAFAQMGAVESFHRISDSSHPVFDLSENNMASCLWPWLYNRCGGASFDAATGSLVAVAKRTARSFIAKGALLESRDPYDPFGHNDVLCGDSNRPQPRLQVNGFRWVVNGISSLKKAIYTRGPLVTSFYIDEAHLSDHWVYYYPGCTTMPNHGVLLVGWDDAKPHPGGKGCWIVKNSWGPTWGLKGYFYIAYGSGNLGYNNENVSYTSVKLFDPGENLYMEDLPGMTSAMGGYQSSSGYGAIVFSVPNTSEKLTHVDFYTTTHLARYEIKVFGTVTGSEWYVTFSNLVASATGRCQEMGYYSIPLPTPPILKTKTKYAVQVKFTNPDGSPPLPIALPNQYIDPTFVGNGTALSYARLGESGGFTRPKPNAGFSITPVCIRARSQVISQAGASDLHKPQFEPN